MAYSLTLRFSLSLPNLMWRKRPSSTYLVLILLQLCKLNAVLVAQSDLKQNRKKIFEMTLSRRLLYVHVCKTNMNFKKLTFTLD